MADSSTADDNGPRATVTQQKQDDLTNVCASCGCHQIDLKKPFVIATAKDSAATKRKATDPGVVTAKSDVPDDAPILLGDDATSGTGGTLPSGQGGVSSDEGTLKSSMSGLLGVYAGDDTDKNAERMFSAFQSKKSGLTLYHDDKIDKEVDKDANFNAFANLTLNSPINTPHSGQRRIHQALKEVGWDINAVKPINDLGAPAFNSGDRTPYGFMNSGEGSNGLFVMFDGVQYVFVHVTKYHYDDCLHQYKITLEFHLYDVFGLDPDDVKTYGKDGTMSQKYWYAIGSGSTFDGITSWWQLQHQHGYAPLLTKIVETRSWTVPTD